MAATKSKWTELAECNVGTPYGHVPGHQYNDVTVTIENRGGDYRCRVLEVWGSAQGYDEEHGRKSVVGRGASVSEAVQDAKGLAVEAEIDGNYLAQALSQARDKADSN